MIGQRIVRTHPSQICPEKVVEAAHAIFNRRQPLKIPRWVCEGCGMIHQRSMPLVCDSCGNKHLIQQADIHREMNNHW